MRRIHLLLALPCSLAAVAAVVLASGAFRGPKPDPAAPGPSAAEKPDPGRAAEPAAGAGGRPAHQPYPFKRVVVVAVGINEYPKLRGTTDLRYAEADAAEVADVCEALYGFEVVRLTGAKATKREVELTLKRYARELGEEDALVAYFAGHGQVVPLSNGEEAGYLLPADADLDITDTGDPARWAAQALDMQFLSDLLDGANARHVVFLADACCSGFLTRRGALERADLKTFLLGDKSRTVLAATTRRQSAREDAATKHGYFTAALLAELRKDDAASVLDLYVPVMKGVAAKTNGAMTPQFGQVGAGDGMFVFIPKSIPRSQIEADLNGRTLDDAPAHGLAAVQARARERAGAKTTFAEVVEAYEALPYRLSATPEETGKRWEAKFARYQLNAGLGDPWAMAALHFCFAKGLGTEKSPDRAYHWARQADRFKAPAGLGPFLLGRCRRHGLGVGEGNEVAAARLFAASAEQGFALGKVAVADDLLKANPSGDELRRARGLLESARADGVGTASLLLARFHLGFVKGEELRVEDGVRLLEEAAANGVPAADHALYEAFVRDRTGFPAKDRRRAKECLIRAAEAGYPASQQLLAASYYREDPFPPTVDLPRDRDKAFFWASLAAQQSDANAAGLAHAILAHLYERGHGVGVSADKAKHHFEEGVRLNCPHSQYFLGYRLLVSDSLFKQDYDRAFELAKRSAAQGNANGHYLLGHIYHQWMHPVSGKYGWRRPADFEYHGGSHHILHHYFQAHAKGHRDKNVTGYLDSYRTWLAFERDRGADAFLAKASGNRLPSAVLARLEEEYPETARALAAETPGKK